MNKQKTERQYLEGLMDYLTILCSQQEALAKVVLHNLEKSGYTEADADYQKACQAAEERMVQGIQRWKQSKRS